MAEQDKQRGASLGASPQSQGSPLGSPLGSGLSPGPDLSTMHPARLVAGNLSLEKTQSRGNGTAGGGEGGGAGGGAGSEMVEDVESWHDPLKALVKRFSDGVPAPLDAYVEGIMLEAATVITSTIITPAPVVDKPSAQREGATGEERDLEEVAQAAKESENGGGRSWFGGERRREGAVIRGVQLILEGHFVLTLTAIVMDNPKLQREWRCVCG